VDWQGRTSAESEEEGEAHFAQRRRQPHSSPQLRPHSYPQNGCTSGYTRFEDGLRAASSKRFKVPRCLGYISSLLDKKYWTTHAGFRGDGGRIPLPTYRVLPERDPVEFSVNMLVVSMLAISWTSRSESSASPGRSESTQ